MKSRERLRHPCRRESAQARHLGPGVPDSPRLLAERRRHCPRRTEQGLQNRGARPSRGVGGQARIWLFREHHHLQIMSNGIWWRNPLISEEEYNA